MQNILNIAKGIGWIDGLVLSVILFLLIRGFVRGASGELSSLISSVAMVVFFIFGFPPLLGKLKALTVLASYPQASGFIAFILIIVAAIVIWLVLRNVLARSISLILPKLFDRILGGIFGGIKAVILVIFLCAFGFLSTTENAQQQAAKRSVVIEKLRPFLTKLLTHG